jgi:hypothetical protein
MEKSNGTNGNIVVSHLNGRNNGHSNGVLKDLETSDEKKERMKSLIIVYFTLFLQSVGLASVMTGVWPFLDKVRFPIEYCEPFIIE